jgi:hypothetical protein
VLRPHGRDGLECDWTRVGAALRDGERRLSAAGELAKAITAENRVEVLPRG